MTPQQLLTAIQAGSFAPVYLFLGPEMYRRRVCRKLMIEKLFPEAASREEGFTRHDLDETDLREVLDDAGAYSLFATRRLIWVSAAESVLPRGNAPETEAKLAGMIASYAKHPTPDVVVVFDASRVTFDNEDKTKLDRLRKLFAAASATVEFPPYSAGEASRLARDLAQRAGLEITPALLDSLVESLGNDAARIAVELEKLRLFTGGERAVSAQDIAVLAPDARATTVFALVDALGRGDRASALDLLETLFREGEYIPLALSFAATQFRLALTAKEEGLRSVQQIMGHFSKLGVRMWPSRANQVLQTLNAFSKPQIENALVSLYEADRDLRDRPPDERIVLDGLVFRLAR